MEVVVVVARPKYRSHSSAPTALAHRQSWANSHTQALVDSGSSIGNFKGTSSVLAGGKVPYIVKTTVLTVSGISGRDFSQISVVITLHLQIENFGFGVAGFGDQEFVEQALSKEAEQKCH